MSTSKTGLDAFERSLKDSLDQFEVPYNSADWTQMERSLNGNGRGWWVSGLGLSVLVAGLVVVGGGTWYALTSARSVPERLADGASTTVPGLAAQAPTSTVPAKDIVTVMPETKGTTVVDLPKSGTETSQDNSDTGNRASKGAHIPNAAETSPKEAPPTEKPATITPATPNANEITFKASIAEGCPGTSVDFKVSNMPEDGIYLWNFGDGSFSNHPNPEHTFTKAGRYQVMLSMSAAGVGTIQNKPSSDVIEIHEAPMAAFNVLKQEYDGHLPSVHFENRSLAGAKYSWDFGDGQTSTIAHPDHVYKKKGVYQVELTVTNETGCEDKVMKDVRIDKDYNLDAPVSFSPNGDEFQETFMPEALRTLGVKFNLTVYSANGTLLYQTNDASKPWTGRPQNRGNICGAGDYVWVVDVRESLHLAETYTGKVRLER